MKFIHQYCKKVKKINMELHVPVLFSIETHADDDNECKIENLRVDNVQMILGNLMKLQTEVIKIVFLIQTAIT